MADRRAWKSSLSSLLERVQLPPWGRKNKDEKIFFVSKDVDAILK